MAVRHRPLYNGMVYTFGDNEEASRRLHRLAEVYEQETRDLLNATSLTNGVS